MSKLFFKANYLILLCLALFNLNIRAEELNLPNTIEVAKSKLAEQNAESTVLQALAEELMKEIQVYPGSSLVPDALGLAAQLYVRLGDLPLAASTAEKVVSVYPQSEFAEPCYFIAYNFKTENGKNPGAGVKLTELFALGLGNTARAGKYYEQAIQIYKQNNQWREAVNLAKHYSTSVPSESQPAEFCLELADIALLDGDNSLAKQTLENFLQKNRNLPQTIPARTRLGKVYSACGDEKQAKEQFELVWTSFSKNKKKPEFKQEFVTQSAAEALFALQNEERVKFTRLTGCGTEFSENQARKTAESLVKSYQQVMKTDPSMSAKALNTIGDIYNALADALLQEGYRKAAQYGFENTKNTPFEKAMPEYASAIANYSQAYEKCLDAAKNTETETLQKYGATRSFELTMGQGDVLFAWAIELNKTAPDLQLGAEEIHPKFCTLTQKVVPLLTQGLQYKSQALAIALNKNLPESSQGLKESITIPAESMMKEMIQLCDSEWKSLKSNSSQLASCYTHSGGISSGKSLSNELPKKFERSAECAQKGLNALNQVYAFLKNCQPSETVKERWNTTITEFCGDYASLCQQFGTDLAASLSKIDKNDMGDGADQYKLLAKLQSKNAEKEYAALVQSYEVAARFNINNAETDKLWARLAALDPNKYGTLLETQTASRKGR